jgi:hypothetical protein
VPFVRLVAVLPGVVRLPVRGRHGRPEPRVQNPEFLDEDSEQSRVVQESRRYNSESVQDLRLGLHGLLVPGLVERAECVSMRRDDGRVSCDLRGVFGYPSRIFVTWGIRLTSLPALRRCSRGPGFIYQIGKLRSVALERMSGANPTAAASSIEHQ